MLNFAFLETFLRVGAELGRLLGVQFVPGAPANETPVGRSLLRVLQLLNAGRQQEARWELMRLTFLMKWLGEIEDVDASLLATFARRLLRSDISAYLGVRHEIATAAHLIRKGLQFVHEQQGRPDFWVTVPDGTIGIECTSAHVATSVANADLYVVEPSDPGSKDIAYKLASAIRTKAKKPYASAEVLLTIDATNVFALSGSQQPGTDEAAAALASSGFGCALVFSLLFDRDDDVDSAQMCYVRLDSPVMAPPLLAFLNEHFPKGDLQFERFVTPLVP